jgi:hypothetical protein
VKTGYIMIKLEPCDKEAWQKEADKRGFTLSEFIRRCVAKEVQT